MGKKIYCKECDFFREGFKIADKCLGYTKDTYHRAVPGDPESRNRFNNCDLFKPREKRSTKWWNIF